MISLSLHIHPSSPPHLSFFHAVGWLEIGVRTQHNICEGNEKKKKKSVLYSLTQSMCFRLDDLCFSKIVRSYLVWSRLQKQRQTPALIHSPLSSTLCERARVSFPHGCRGGAAYGKEYRIRPSITTTTVFLCANESERATARNVPLAVCIDTTRTLLIYSTMQIGLFSPLNLLTPYWEFQIENDKLNEIFLKYLWNIVRSSVWKANSRVLQTWLFEKCWKSQ